MNRDIFLQIPESALTDLPGHDFKWLCLLDYEDQYSNLRFGLCETGWVRSGGERSVYVIRYETENFLSLFPLLQKPFPELEERVNSILDSLGLNVKWEQVIPVEQVILPALTDSAGSFWMKSAIDWLVQKPELINERVLASLKLVHDTKRVNQQYRHLIFRILKRAEKVAGVIHPNARFKKS